MGKLEDEINKIVEGTEETTIDKLVKLFSQVKEEGLKRSETLAYELMPYLDELDELPTQDQVAISIMLSIYLKEAGIHRTLLRAFCIGRVYERKRLEESEVDQGGK
jgi:hypothetical protein